MKFSEMEYKRPDIKAFSEEFDSLLKKFNETEVFEVQVSIMGSLIELRKDFESMYLIIYIKHTLNTKDKFYDEEQIFFDKNMPIYRELVSKFYGNLVNSKFRQELEGIYGRQLFNVAESAIKTISPEIIEYLQEENKLITEYRKLLASSKIIFNNGEMTLSQLVPFTQSKDREVRKAANEVKYLFYNNNKETLDDIYDNLVKIRTTIAKKLGYKNYVKFGYDRLCRTDYNEEMVEKFRSDVEKYIVPLASKLYERQKKRLGIEALMYYDERFLFKTSNAKPKGDFNCIKHRAEAIYSELSLETKEFFQYMLENELMELDSKKDKAVGGYCTYISKYKYPFIFSNSNGTTGDIVVLTHEVGHAFQAYCSRNFELPDYIFPTAEASEISSMGMEFLTWPWMKSFFEDEADKYKFTHLSEAILFIPYAASVDEFQHFVYTNPKASSGERKQAWKVIERKYLPHRQYGDNSFLNEGGFWQLQTHIYEAPLYYIDYALAEICALQFWAKSQSSFEEAWSNYLSLCKAGGSKSFNELIDLSNLVSPFENGCIEEIMSIASQWLDNIDDIKL